MRKNVKLKTKKWRITGGPGIIFVDAYNEEVAAYHAALKIIGPHRRLYKCAFKMKRYCFIDDIVYFYYNVMIYTYSSSEITTNSPGILCEICVSDAGPFPENKV
jgi:hypothetical protein